MLSLLCLKACFSGVVFFTIEILLEILIGASFLVMSFFFRLMELLLI